MAELKNYPAKSPDGKNLKLTIASGPVIIKNRKVLLVKHSDSFWKFPGGSQLTDLTLEENAIKEAKEEANIDISISGDPYVIEFPREKEFVILFHFPAKIIKGTLAKGKDIDELNWFDINRLPKNCAPNIEPVVNYFKK